MPFVALELLLRPAVTLYSFDGVSRVPALQTELFLLPAVCIGAVLGERIAGKSGLADSRQRRWQ